MIHCGPPKTRYGRALLYTVVILHRLQWKIDRQASQNPASSGTTSARSPIRANTCVCSVVQHGHTTLTQLDLTPTRDKLDPRADLNVFVGSDPLRRCYILETLTGKEVLSANCTFNESLFPWKQQTTYVGPSSSDSLDSDPLRFPITRVPASLPLETDEPDAR